jgi:hypothetical protein
MFERLSAAAIRTVAGDLADPETTNLPVFDTVTHVVHSARAPLSPRHGGSGARVAIARPSVIIGHPVLGVGPSSSLFWYYRALAAVAPGPFAGWVDVDSRRRALEG